MLLFFDILPLENGKEKGSAPALASKLRKRSVPLCGIPVATFGVPPKASQPLLGKGRQE
jgi:hypothetical protein